MVVEAPSVDESAMTKTPTSDAPQFQNDHEMRQDSFIRLTLPTDKSRLALSTEEVDAEEKISGGNLSASSGAIVAEATAHVSSPDQVMTKIYQENN